MLEFECLLGIDVGTYGLKASLWSVDGRPIYTATREYSIKHTRRLWAEQEPEVWWQSLKSATEEALRRSEAGASNIIGVGVSAFVPPLVLLDRRGKVLRPAILSFDQRSTIQADWLRGRFGEEVFEITGNRIAPGAFSATSMVWVKEVEPDVFDKVHKFMHACSYIVYKLTGEFSMDYSNASMTLLFDTSRRKWSERLCQLFGVPIDKLPEAKAPWDVVGELTPEAARGIGLEKGVPVVAGGNDSACSMLGAGVVEPGMVFESIGSSIVLAYVNDKPFFDDRLMNRCHVVPERWFNLAGMSTPGASYRWFREEFGDVEKVLAARLGIGLYELLDREAATSPPGANGLIFLPYLSGERSPIWNSNARGVFFGLTLSHSRGDFIRSILEGGAYAALDNMEVFKEHGLEIWEIRITGGGARSELWRQIMADVLGVSLKRPLSVETATLGAAILAGCGAGVYGDPSLAAKRIVRVEDGEKPREKEHNMYVKRFRLFKKIYEGLVECFDFAGELESDLGDSTDP